MLNARSLFLIAGIATAFLATESVLAQQTIKPLGRRIVGGEKTDIEKHPWQVALRFQGSFFCGGSIIAAKWILTAAHCFKFSTKAEDWRFKAGATNYVTTGVWSEVDRIIVHEKYNSTSNENDIALVKMKTEIKNLPSPRAIALPSASLTIPTSQPLEVTGWGATQEGGEGSNVLLKATVPLTDTAVCNKSAAPGSRVSPTMICAGYKEGGVDSCQGDSGGPLVWRTPDGPVLVGVVSFGEGCAQKLKYGVYTRVTAHLDWIDRMTKANGN
jgi:secreted trypsin-like serine protease